MDSPDITPLDGDPVRLHDDTESDAALRSDLAACRDAIVVGLDYAAIEAELVAAVTRDACG